MSPTSRRPMGAGAPGGPPPGRPDPGTVHSGLFLPSQEGGGYSASSAHADFSQLSWAVRSHPGAVRESNEDFVGVRLPTAVSDDRGPIFVLADGMGGHAAGEVASRIAVETVIQRWATGKPPAPHQAIRAAVRDANVAIFDASMENSRRGMGCTCTALALQGPEAFIGHVGDSRAYHVRNRQCTQLTADHSRVGDMLRMRLITPEQAAHHPARSQLTRSLGTEPMVQVDLVRQRIDLGDSFVLCCDGLWDLVSRAEIAEAVGGRDAESAADALLEKALERGAHDNVSVIVVSVVSKLPADPRAAAGAESLLGRVRRRLPGIRR